MVLKTIAEKGAAGAVLLDSGRVEREDGSSYSYETWVTEEDYGDEFVEALTEEVAKYYLHTVTVRDYESNSDAGNGYDDYSKDEADEDIAVSDCIIDNGKPIGFLCTGFGRKAVLFIEKGHAEVLGTCYSGRGYHRYESKKFVLRRR